VEGAGSMDIKTENIQVDNSDINFISSLVQELYSHNVEVKLTVCSMAFKLNMLLLLYTTEALQSIKHWFLLLVRLELTSSSLQLDVILYTTEVLHPTLHKTCFPASG
jgi:hypothetical protein